MHVGRYFMFSATRAALIAESKRRRDARARVRAAALETQTNWSATVPDVLPATEPERELEQAEQEPS